MHKMAHFVTTGLQLTVMFTFLLSLGATAHQLQNDEVQQKNGERLVQQADHDFLYRDLELLKQILANLQLDLTVSSENAYRGFMQGPSRYDEEVIEESVNKGSLLATQNKGGRLGALTAGGGRPGSSGGGSFGGGERLRAVAEGGRPGGGDGYEPGSHNHGGYGR